MDNIFFKSLFAFSIAFILQSSYRFIPGVGLGEICLAIVILTTIITCIRDPERVPQIKDATFAYLINFYVFVILFLVTALNFYLLTVGNSFRDFLAYSLSALMLFSMSVHREKVKDIAILFIHFSFIIIVFQYLFGDQSSNFDVKENDPFFFDRFKAGAKNPNQFALYLVCLITISFLLLRNKYLKFIYFLFFLYFGLQSFSDAFLAFLAVVFVSYLSFNIMPKKYIYAGVTGFAVVLVLLSLAFFEQSANFLSDQWSERDQGNARLILYWNGLQAWLSNPITLLLGNGAGNFSGLYGPFGLFEAHNGPIDTLAMGGLIGFCILFVYPLRFIYQSFIIQDKILFSLCLGVLFFSLFHFLMRHPVYWFTLFVIYVCIQEKIIIRKKCAD